MLFRNLKKIKEVFTALEVTGPIMHGNHNKNTNWEEPDIVEENGVVKRTIGGNKLVEAICSNSVTDRMNMFDLKLERMKCTHELQVGAARKLIQKVKELDDFAKVSITGEQID